MRIRQAGIRQRDQARIQNLRTFKEREEERQKKGQPIGAALDQLAGSMTTPQQQGVAAAQQDAPPSNVVKPPAGEPMEEGEGQTKDNDPMGDGGAEDKDGDESGKIGAA
ncbi:MAG: hypothetical protein GY835_16510 [bacterium]|nr:hypothetical protein [bacterium]